jgi:hypothetical protein
MRGYVLPDMVRALALLLAIALLAPAAVRLYMKDGQYHNVREYKVEGDRVRYYSTERSEWEEIPLQLIDLKRTEAEIRQKQEERQAEAKQIDAEDAAEREQREEVERIPLEAGVFVIEGEKVTTLKQAESKVVSNKRRNVLKVLTPIPIVSGKATVELDGAASAYTVPKNRPEFYMRLAAEERFAIIRLTPTKSSRIVQKWDIVPVSKEIVEQTDIIETFKQQIGDGLYKIWPTKLLEPGQYAVVEYTEGKGNIQVWDFTVAP